MGSPLAGAYYAELLAERFGAPPRLPPPIAPRPAVPVAPPTTLPVTAADWAAIAERQRVLCEALDDGHLVAVEARERAA